MPLPPPSEEKLNAIHPDLAAVVHRAVEITAVPFIVTEGVRSMERQAQLVKVGASQTYNSRHLTGHAVDLAALVNGEVRWDWPLYFQIAEAMRQAAEELGTPVRWGGTWKQLNGTTGPLRPANLSRSFPDGPHYELPRTGDYA